MKTTTQPLHPQRQPVFHGRLLKALEEFPRRLFFPEGTSPEVSDEVPVPLRAGRAIPPVSVVAMMLEALDLDGRERVLDIGCGSGYQAALLSRLAREVVTVELDEELARRAACRLAELGCSNVRVIQADAGAGWPERAPYQGIVVGAAATELPSKLIEQLDLGGRLVVPLGDVDNQLVERLRKRADTLDSATIGACHLDMLVSSRQTSSFPWASRHEG